MRSYQNLRVREPTFLFEAVEKIQLNSTVAEVCRRVLQKCTASVEKFPQIRYVQYALLLVDSKVVLMQTRCAIHHSSCLAGMICDGFAFDRFHVKCAFAAKTQSISNNELVWVSYVEDVSVKTNLVAHKGVLKSLGWITHLVFTSRKLHWACCRKDSISSRKISLILPAINEFVIYVFKHELVIKLIFFLRVLSTLAEIEISLRPMCVNPCFGLLLKHFMKTERWWFRSAHAIF